MPRMTFILPDGTRREVEAAVGDSILRIAHDNGIHEIEGACEGSLACATCHVIVDPAWYGRLPPVDDDEADMLDFAIGLTPTSRLGCQVELVDELDGLVVTVPDEA